MAITWTSEIDAVLSVGQDLNSAGVRNWALDSSSALRALDQFLAMKVSVLGGDVYEIKNGVVEISYDNWYCDPLDGESESDFSVRSILVAKKYISAYPSVNKAILFAIVPKVD